MCYKKKFKEINFKDQNGDVVATLRNRVFMDESTDKPYYALELYVPCAYKKIRTFRDVVISDPLIFDDIALKLKKYDKKKGLLNFQFVFKAQDEIANLTDIATISCLYTRIIIVNADNPDCYRFNVHFTDIEIIEFTEIDQEEEENYQKIKNNEC